MQADEPGSTASDGHGGTTQGNRNRRSSDPFGGGERFGYGGRAPHRPGVAARGDAEADARRFMRKLFERVTPGRKSSNLVENLVLLFSKVAVLVSMLGLLYGAWISAERYGARQRGASTEQGPGSQRGSENRQDARSQSNDRSSISYERMNPPNR